MPQLHLSVDERTVKLLTQRAKDRGVSLSHYLAQLVKKEFPEPWPDGYLDSVIGCCSDGPLEEPADLALDEVDL